MDVSLIHERMRMKSHRLKKKKKTLKKNKKTDLIAEELQKTFYSCADNVFFKVVPHK